MEGDVLRRDARTLKGPQYLHGLVHLVLIDLPRSVRIEELESIANLCDLLLCQFLWEPEAG